MTSTLVRKYIFERPLGAVFTARECMNFGNSTAVYKCLLRAIRDGYIVRVAWGAYYRPDPRRPNYLPSLEEIVLAKDRAFGRTTMAHECDLLDDIMALPIPSSWRYSGDDLERSCCHGSTRVPASLHRDDRSASKKATEEDSSAKDKRVGHKNNNAPDMHSITRPEFASRRHLMNTTEEPVGIDGFSCSVPMASNSNTVFLVKGRVTESTASSGLKYQTGAIDVVAGSVTICATAKEQSPVSNGIKTLKHAPRDKEEGPESVTVYVADKQVSGPAAIETLTDETLDKYESPEFVTVCIPAAQELVSEPAVIETLDETLGHSEGEKCVIASVTPTHEAVSNLPAPGKSSSAANSPSLHILMSDTADSPAICLDSAASKAATVAIGGMHDSLADQTNSTTTTLRQKKKRIELKDAVYDTDGNTSSFNTIHGRVYLHRVSARKMQLGDSADGKVLRALWCVGASNMNDTYICRGMNSLGRREKERLRARLWLTPNWLKDELVMEHIWKYARPAA